MPTHKIVTPLENISPNQEAIEQKLLQLYDFKYNSKTLQREILELICNQQKACDLAILVYLRAINAEDDWRHSKLRQILINPVLNNIWQNAIEQLVEKYCHDLPVENDRPLFDIYASLVVFIEVCQRHDRYRHSHSAIHAYENDNLTLAVEHLTQANRIKASNEALCLREYWHYLATDNISDALAEQYYELHPNSPIANKLELLKNYCQKDLDKCILNAASIKQLQPNYPFLILPALLALKSNNTNLTYELIDSLLLEDCDLLTKQTISKSQKMMSHLFNLVSHLPWSRIKATDYADENQNHWKVVCLLALTNIKQQYYQRAQDLLLTIMPKAYHFPVVINLFHALQYKTRSITNDFLNTNEKTTLNYHIKTITTHSKDSTLHNQLTDQSILHPRQKNYLLAYHKENKRWYLLRLRQNKVQMMPVICRRFKKQTKLFAKSFEQLTVVELEILAEAIANWLAQESQAHQSSKLIKKIISRKPKNTDIDDLCSQALEDIFGARFISMEQSSVLHSDTVRNAMNNHLHDFKLDLQSLDKTIKLMTAASAYYSDSENITVPANAQF